MSTAEAKLEVLCRKVGVHGDGLQGDRSTWTPWKVPKPDLRLVRYDNSFVMVAAHQGSYGKLEFRGCNWRRATRRAPSTIGWLRSRLPRSTPAARAGVEINR